MLASGAILAPGPPPTTAKDRAVGKGSFIPSINVDSCIIEEQEDHLVLAIRVPKATIVSNLALFGALAGCCGMAIPRVWSTRDDPPLMSDHREAYAALGRRRTIMAPPRRMTREGLLRTGCTRPGIANGRRLTSWLPPRRERIMRGSHLSPTSTKLAADRKRKGTGTVAGKYWPLISESLLRFVPGRCRRSGPTLTWTTSFRTMPQRRWRG
jgi:hypothetical protein